MFIVNTSIDNTQQECFMIKHFQTLALLAKSIAVVYPSLSTIPFTRSLQHAKVVPWMRKTEYISTEFNRYGISNEKPEIK